MTRPLRLNIGSALILAIGCAAAQRAERVVPAADRVTIEIAALREACAACNGCGPPDVQTLCKLIQQDPPDASDDSPRSGDSGPAISQGAAAGLGNGVRAIGGASGR